MAHRLYSTDICSMLHPAFPFTNVEYKYNDGVISPRSMNDPHKTWDTAANA